MFQLIAIIFSSIHFLHPLIGYIAVPAGGAGGQLPPKFRRFGQNQNFSGSDNDQKNILCQMQKKVKTFFCREHYGFATKIKKSEIDSK